jgi:ribosome-associated protein
VNAGGRVREDGGVNAREVSIREDSIRLGQLLKLADLVEAGAEVKPLMVQGLVSVNGEVETRRGRQLVKGDVVTLGGESVLVTRRRPGPPRR